MTGSSSHSIFGSIGEIDSTTLTIMIIVIVSSVLLIEHTFEIFRKLTNETPFRHIISAVEQELMVVGFTAFLFKIVYNNNNFLTTEQFLSLEFADVLVPVFSISNCILGIFLIFASLFQCDIWSKAFHLQLEQLLEDFMDLLTRRNFSTFLPFSRILSEMEFRIFHCIFCESFSIQRKAFAFDQYVQLVTEKYIIKIVRIGPINWFIFCCCLLLNLVRSQNKVLLYMSCEMDDIECEKHRALIIFTFAGVAVFAIVIVFAFCTRYYEIQIIRARGISSTHYYSTFLQYMETLVEKPRVQQRRLNESELKVKILEAKAATGKKVEFIEEFRSNPCAAIRKFFESLWLQRGSNYRPRIFPVTGSRSSSTGSPKVVDMDFKESELKVSIPTFPGEMIRRRSIDSPASSVYSSVESFKDTECAMPVTAYSGDDDSVRPFPVVKPSTGTLAQVPHGSNHRIHESGPMVEHSSFIDMENRHHHHHVAVTSTKSHEAVPLRVTTPMRSMRKSVSSFIGMVGESIKMKPNYKKDISFLQMSKLDNARKIFLVHSPELFFGCIQFLGLVISMYVSLWVMNFSFTARSTWEKIYSLLPGLASGLVYVYVVKSSALLKAVYELDKDAMLEVMEQTEGSRLLGEMLKKELLTRVDINIENPRSELYAIFSNIDDQGRNNLRRDEFEFFMHSVGIEFSRKKWQQIFREIDLNNDDLISFEEFFLFMCPDHDVARALETRRKKIVKNRATKKTLEFAEAMARLGKASFTYKARSSFESGSPVLKSPSNSANRLPSFVRNRVVSIARSAKARLERRRQEENVEADMEVQSISQRSEGSLAHSTLGNNEEDCYNSELDGRVEETSDQLSPLPSFNSSPLRTPLRLQQQNHHHHHVDE